MDDSKIHYFDVEIAKELGVDCAIMLNHLIYWIATNSTKTRNYIDKRTWTYCSITEFKKYFSYWSTSQIRRIINTLIKKEILLVDNFNKHKYDRTNWYSLNDNIQ